ncbi:MULTISPECIES: hypothetical protein [unclassified Cryobacterium]|uniref:hypothetical protein n=1 Tax=unclassified Cryobacterium TaxID=2649013 RepID=UPI00106C8552|nr:MULTISPECIES: hypothetical protein [unclassified Cryobacterium]TFC56135.1 hypothetical protein E3O68_05000 [Cryobacterium sp. TMB3-1-2]TFC62623.1 hypothetical protein E3O60_01890 [Cryobacterium sp. TMB1-7]TFC69631.1 hypothetical protein E3T21_11505 [Cryobacterium sp. TMB3-15]TFC77997.1 hypothetical protein E3T22_03990 [Cryobacterium sp. TMB3-10]TFC84921.1 hypothetical protein E3T19_18355 [Cryobacterium sp. TMT4-31]
MRNTRSRLIMVGIVAGVAVLSVGATAYAAGQDSRPTTNVLAAASAPTARATPSATPSTAPAPVATPTAAAAATGAGADTPDEVVVADETTNTDGTAGDEATGGDASGSGAEGDGNVVEVRTPNPDAIPDTPAEYEYFYGLISQCMAEAGYDWHAVRHTVDGEFAGVDMTRLGDVEPGLQAGFTLALDGDTGGGDYYHWADAGCWGYAVHVTGNDGNN